MIEESVYSDSLLNFLYQTISFYFNINVQTIELCHRARHIDDMMPECSRSYTMQREDTNDYAPEWTRNASNNGLYSEALLEAFEYTSPEEMMG